jgi:RES domain-containing protein
MAVRGLDAPMRAYRIGDPDGRYPIYSGEGAALFEGRWHEKGQEIIYASEHYSTAMLEKLAHFNGILPANQHFLAIEIPVKTSYEVVTKDSLPVWTDASKARQFGAAWFAARRSAILIVPSYVAREERNILINPHHPDAKAIRPGLETPIWWDPRVAK